MHAPWAHEHKLCKPVGRVKNPTTGLLGFIASPLAYNSFGQEFGIYLESWHYADCLP